VVVDYTGATKKAKVAVRASGNTGYNRELPSAQAIVVNTLYLLSARHLAKVDLTMSDGVCVCVFACVFVSCVCVCVCMFLGFACSRSGFSMWMFVCMRKDTPLCTRSLTRALALSHPLSITCRQFLRPPTHTPLPPTHTHTGTHALAHTDATSTYTMAYRDYSATLQAHARGQPFFWSVVRERERERERESEREEGGGGGGGGGKWG